MKIQLITGPFFPQIHPRSFRMTELAKEFVRQGHDVIVTNYMVYDDYDYEAYAQEVGIKKIIRLPMIHKSQNERNENRNRKPSKARVFFHSLMSYLFAGTVIPRAKWLAQHVSIDSDTDMVIATSTPYFTILGVSYYIRKNRHKLKPTCTLIADSGDPFYYSKQDNWAFWFKWVEKRSYQQYDYLTIPVDTALICYNKICPDEKIKIIPQGFNMRDMRLYNGEFSGPVKFAYSGVFYEGIRNPDFLFAYLDKQCVDYEFHWFMRYNEPTFLAMLEKYPNLKAKTHIRISVPRNELLYELSRMDFLINLENLSNTQIPSKLIDYGIVKRPIISFNKLNFNKQKMTDYLHRRFYDSMNIEIDKYNIERVAHQFLDLHGKV